MARLVTNYTANGSTLTDEYGTLFALSDLIGNGGVIKGMAVAANTSPAMNVYVQTGSAAIPTGTAPSNYSYFVKIDTSGQGEQVTIATAASSPRIDYIVAYINKGQAGSTGVTNNTNNVFMLADVPGTPASSPVVPTTAQIQSVVGAANPYLILAQIAVGANATQITTPNITDMRSYASAAATLPAASVKASNIDFTTISASTAIPSGTFSTTSFPPVQVTGASVTLTLAKPASVEVMARCQAMYNSVGTGYTEPTLWVGTVGSGTKIAHLSLLGANTTPMVIFGETGTLAAGTYTFNLGLNAGTTGTASIFNNSPNTGVISAKIIG